MQKLQSSSLFFASLLLSTVWACGEVKSDGGSDAASTTDATIPMVDAAVEVDATLGEPDASFACVPNSVECNIATLTQCDATGQVPVETACALGCMGPSRCADLDPSNGLASNLDSAATTLDVTFTGTATIDTSAGVISDSNGAFVLSTEIITGGPVELFVVEVKSLAASDINVIGNRALAIVSDGDITISGVLDASADLNRPGAGALNSSSTCQGGQGGATGAYGGGGGGFGQTGGQGGGASIFTSGGLPGMTSGNAMLEPLRGGCRGGNGGTNELNSSPTDSSTDPGAGGGAVQLVSNTMIALGNGATIAVNGGGGKSWTGGLVSCFDSSLCYPGEGGGSGGAILLEAPVVTVVNGATLNANGGGGSCGQYGGGSNGINGATPTPGGDCEGLSKYGNGGNGGGGTKGNGGNGAIGVGDFAIGGGAGGGVGRIRVNLPVGSVFSPDGVVSPAATAGSLGTR